MADGAERTGTRVRGRVAPYETRDQGHEALKGRTVAAESDPVIYDPVDVGHCALDIEARTVARWAMMLAPLLVIAVLACTITRPTVARTSPRARTHVRPGGA